ncbi:hypothetical protein SLE2022_356820 [Rubroshorea leprosula]
MASSSPYSLYLILLSLLPVYVVAQTHQNIALDSSLTAALNINSSWKSPSGDFAFGFQQIRAGEFLLAIWFDKIPEKTIIWSANGEKLVQEGSKIQLTTDGQFSLSDTRGEEVWAAKLSGSGIVSYAAMLDTGNFVLASHDSIFLWESFNLPTDTIVPTQIMKLGSSILARQAENNYSRGRFLLAMQLDGNLVLYQTNFPSDSPLLVIEAYWTSNTVGSGFQFIFSQYGDIDLQDENGTVRFSMISNGDSSGHYYQRPILEYDGVFRHYVYPKNDNGTARSPMNWVVLSFEPPNICAGRGESKISALCGVNSYCSFGDVQRAKCDCLPRYSFFDPNDKMKGCKHDFILQDCNGNQDADHFDFVDIPNMDWTQTYENFKDVTEDWCKQSCLVDCYCPLAIFRNGECAKKKVPLVSGKERFNLPEQTKARVCEASHTRSLRKLQINSKKNLEKVLVQQFTEEFLTLAQLVSKSSNCFWNCRGLDYLHEECSNAIIYCDIKPQNILLDDSLTARISDFGLAKLLKTGQTRTVTVIRGTKGYVAPEWFKNKPVTIKVDVYSFGILLLELICCRKSFEQDSENENQRILADWAYDCYEEGRLYLLVQEDEEAIQDIKRVERFVMIAIWCIQEDPSLRPAMKRVSQMLEGAVEVSHPPTIPPSSV